MSSRSKNPQIYVKGYGRNINRDDLKRWFKSYGKIIGIQYKGPYSFIEYEDYYDAEQAIADMNDKKIQGFRLIVEPSGKKKGRGRSTSEIKKTNRRRQSSSSSDSDSRSSSSSSYSSSSSSSSSKSKGKKQKEKRQRSRSRS